MSGTCLGRKRDRFAVASGLFTMGPFSSLLSMRQTGDLIRSRANRNELQVHYSSQVLDKRGYETRGYLDRRQQARRQRGGVAINEIQRGIKKDLHLERTVGKMESVARGKSQCGCALMILWPWKPGLAEGRDEDEDERGLFFGLRCESRWCSFPRPQRGARLTVRTVCKRALLVRIRRWSRGL
jgi:hypothetical protein